MPQWPLTPDDLYVEQAEGRPAFQGDVFGAVPFIKAQAGDTPDAEPKISAERRFVTPILFPCDMYVAASPTLGRVQAVALVRKADMHIPDDWQGAFTVCPLPDLMGDGEMWVSDFRAIANVDRSYLRFDHRVRSLTEVGWTFFRQRLALAATRQIIEEADLQRGGALTWEESALWEQWNDSGRDRLGFHGWYDAVNDSVEGLSPRAALERGMTAQVRLALVRELQ